MAQIDVTEEQIETLGVPLLGYTQAEDITAKILPRVYALLEKTATEKRLGNFSAISQLSLCRSPEGDCLDFGLRVVFGTPNHQQLKARRNVVENGVFHVATRIKAIHRRYQNCDQIYALHTPQKDFHEDITESHLTTQGLVNLIIYEIEQALKERPTVH